MRFAPALADCRLHKVVRPATARIGPERTRYFLDWIDNTDEAIADAHDAVSRSG